VLRQIAKENHREMSSWVDKGVGPCFEVKPMCFKEIGQSGSSWGLINKNMKANQL
jgi:hypothetical protein